MTRASALTRCTARALDRAAEQRVEAAAGGRSEKVDDQDNERERGAQRRAEKRYTDDVGVLSDEDQDRNDEDDDNGYVDPPHQPPRAYTEFPATAFRYTVAFLRPSPRRSNSRRQRRDRKGARALDSTLERAGNRFGEIVVMS